MQRLSHEHSIRAAAHCPACGAANHCALAADPAGASCWCMDAPAQHPLPTAAPAACYCADCLTRLAAAAGGQR